jgi:hypothetical protein
MKGSYFLPSAVMSEFSVLLTALFDIHCLQLLSVQRSLAVVLKALGGVVPYLKQLLAGF